MQDRGPVRASLAGQSFDVLIVGGGINGVAIARECARRGRRVLLAEQNDFASGTTSRSTRIIHGGLRYMEYAEVGLVRESLRERDRLLKNSPHLVRPMQFLLALPREGRSWRRSSLAIRTGLWMYHTWAGERPTPQEAAHEFERQLDSGHGWEVFAYEDAQCEFPERLVAEWLRDAAGAGAVVRNHTRALEVLRSDGRVKGARLRDVFSGEEYEVAAPLIINATGPWADCLVKASSIPAAQMVGGVRGSHLVLPQFAGAPKQAVYTEALDGRTIFIIPWNQLMLVGTTEVADTEVPDNPQPSAAEIDYLWQSFVRLMPNTGLGREHIRYTMAGVRPLPYAPGKKMSAVTRHHILYDHKDDGAAGMTSIIGGKLTTALSLAREVAHRLGFTVVQPGTVYSLAPPDDDVETTFQQWSHMVAERANIPESSAHAIAEWWGRHALSIAKAAAHDEKQRAPLCPHSHHVVAEAVEAVKHESAVTLGDILLRRVPVALGGCWSLTCSQEAAQKIGGTLGWDREHIHRELDRLEKERIEFLHPNKQAVTA